MKNLRTLLFAAILFALAGSANAQSVGINSDGSAPNGSAMLDVSSSSKGFLPPRMTYAEKILIASPSAGLIIWCSNCGAYGELQIYNGSAWQSLIAGIASGLPSAPTIRTATAGFLQASVAFLAPGSTSGLPLAPFTAPGSNGGSPITSYTATSNPGNITGTLNQEGSGTITVTGLTFGTAYTFTVTATNASGTGAASAASNSLTSISAKIGDRACGGIIAYVLQSGDPGYDADLQHGLIAATADQSTGADWGCHGTTVSGADGIALGTGNQNTLDIVAGCSTAGIAARICNDLILNGYSDWYLPGKDELNKVYLNKANIGGFSIDSYWSSTEIDESSAWRQTFSDGSPSGYFKRNTSNVRAVRAF
jgi:hypothetical protein